MSILLFVEYRCFIHETEKMLTLKEDYRNHLVAVNKILLDYNKTKERLEELESNKEKKKPFLPGAKIISSDDDTAEEQQFLVINRDLEYLKLATIQHIKKQDTASVLSRINFDEWQDYNRLVQTQTAQPASKKRTYRRKRVASARYQNRVQSQLFGKSHDITFGWPIERSNFWLSSMFGPRKKPDGSRGFHYGIDMAAVRGTPVYAAGDGVVIEARHAKGYGNTVVIAHNRKYRTRYAHLHAITARVGQNVMKGDLIGKVGSTGYVRSKRGRDGSHLHFEVSAFGKQVNPMYFLC